MLKTVVAAVALIVLPVIALAQSTAPGMASSGGRTASRIHPADRGGAGAIGAPGGREAGPGRPLVSRRPNSAGATDPQRLQR